jgi:hypothetical protein
MKHPHQQPALERECSEVLQQWEDWSEMPMLVFGYLTATLATFFIDRDAESDDAELASAKSI